MEDSEQFAWGVLSVALFMKLNLWWKDATCQVLEEEGRRLGTSSPPSPGRPTWSPRLGMSSMVRMAKQYDSELQELHERLLAFASHKLTGLANRTVFLAQLEAAIDQAPPALGRAGGHGLRPRRLQVGERHLRTWFRG